MKKMICVALALLLLLCGCGGEGSKTTETTWDGLHRAQIKGEDVVFEAWEQEGIPTEGSYYLTKDVTLAQTVTVTGDLKLHLNGHVVSGTEGTVYGNYFIVPAGTSMTLYDEAEAAGTIVSIRSYSGKPTVSSMIVVGGSFTMAGGTLDASAIALENVADGTGIYLQEGATLDVVGGTIIGGAALYTELDTQPPVAQDPTAESGATEQPEAEPVGKGGSVYVAPGAVCNVSGGTISKGSAGFGGNIYVDGNEEKPGILNLTGGTITGGESLLHGGNIYSRGKVLISGGELLSGVAVFDGGNVYCEAGPVDVCDQAYVFDGLSAKAKSTGLGGNFFIAPEGVMTVTGGYISEGKVGGNNNNLSANIRCEGRFVMNNGEITGHIAIVKTGTAHFSGNCNITSNGWELTVEPTTDVVFGKCDEGITVQLFLRLTHFDSNKLWKKGAVSVLRLEEGVDIDINSFFTVGPYREGGTDRTFILRQEGDSLYFEETTKPKTQE